MSTDLHSFITARLSEAIADAEYDALLGKSGHRPSDLGWPDAMPRPFQSNSIVLSMPVSEAVGMGLMEPPDGWQPPPPPPRPPLRTRVKRRVRAYHTRTRMRLASALAGFDVEERD